MTLCISAFAAQQIEKFVHDDERKLLAEHCCETGLVRSPTGQVRLTGKVDDDMKLPEAGPVGAPACT